MLTGSRAVLPLDPVWYYYSQGTTAGPSSIIAERYYCLSCGTTVLLEIDTFPTDLPCPPVFELLHLMFLVLVFPSLLGVVK